MTENRRNPLPQEIYMRRRVAALIGLLVVVGLLLWAATSMFGGSDESVPAASTSARGSEAAPETKATSKAEKTSEATGSKESSTQPASDSATASATNPSEEPKKNTCALADLQLTGSVSKPTYGPGEQPTFYMEVNNPTAVDCVIDLEADTMRFEVYDLKTNQKMWTDTDCYPPVEEKTQTFKPGEPRKFEAVWSRKMSQPGQCVDRQESPVGGYFMHVVIGDNAAPAQTFNLVDANGA
ncbi:hypothetical protein ACOJAB_06470 [Corynebacterium striatum]|uniref:hypothetical protein n=1 Tax=Corynebacterium striatum TaxID=43770 RepID=UPI003B5AB1C8